MNDDNLHDPQRRMVLGGMAGGVAAAGFSGAAQAQTPAEAAAGTPLIEIRDPQTAYP